MMKTRQINCMNENKKSEHLLLAIFIDHDWQKVGQEIVFPSNTWHA